MLICFLLMRIIISGNGVNWGWTEGQCSILAEFGTLQLEFEYLSQVTGNAAFKTKVKCLPRNEMISK